MKRGNPSTLQKRSRLTWMIRATANSSQMEMLPWNLQISMILGEVISLWVGHRWGQTKGQLNHQKHQKLLFSLKINWSFRFQFLFCIAGSPLGKRNNMIACLFLWPLLPVLRQSSYWILFCMFAVTELRFQCTSKGHQRASLSLPFRQIVDLTPTVGFLHKFCSVAGIEQDCCDLEATCWTSCNLLCSFWSEIPHIIVTGRASGSARSVAVQSWCPALWWLLTLSHC